MNGDDGRTLADRLRAVAGLDDDGLSTELRRIAAETDGTPGSVLEAARAAFLTRDLDGELAVLIADSRDDTAAEGFEPVRTGIESDQGGWLMSFVAGGVQIDIEISDERGRLRLLGQLIGASADDCHLELAGGERRRLEVDDLGRFVVENLQHGSVRLRCRSADGTRVTTAWVTI